MMNSDSEISLPSSTRDIRIQQFADSVRSLHVDVTSDLARLDALVRSAHDDIRSLAQSLSGIDRITQKLQPPATEEAIGSLPTVKVTEVDFECAICLEMMVIGSEGKEMMNCKHVFHSDCIDRWLRVRGSCPVCRCTIPAAAAAAAADPVEDNTNNVSMVVDAAAPVL